MTVPTRFVPSVLLQYGESFMPTDEGWMLNPRHIPLNAGECIGSTIMSAMVDELLGPHVAPGVTGNRVMSPETPTLRTGMAVRLLCQDPSGSVSSIVTNRDLKFTPFWWGIVAGQAREVTGGDSTSQILGRFRTLRWVCQDVKTILGRSRVTHSWVMINGVTTRLDRVLPINPTMFGNQASVGGSIDGTAVGVHSLDATGTYAWTLATYLPYLLAAFGRPNLSGVGPSGPIKWVVAGTLPTRRLPFYDPTDKTVLQVLDDLMPEESGLSFRVSVSGAVATLTVFACTPTAITDGTYTLSPSVTPRDIDLRQDRFVEDSPYYARDAIGYDSIEVSGDRPTQIIGLSITAGGNAGDGLIPDGFVYSDVPADPNDAFGDGPEWRNFKINPNLNMAGIAVGLAGSVAAPVAFSLTDNLLVGQGFIPSGSSPQGPVVLCDGMEASTEIPVQIVPGTNQVIIGASGSHGDRIKGSGLTLICGMQHPARLAKRWVRDRSAWPCSAPRMHTLNVPGMTQVMGARSLVVGYLDGGGTKGNRYLDGIGGGGSIYFVDDSATLAQRLLELRARYEIEGGTVEWTQRCLIDFSTLADSSPTALSAIIANFQAVEGPLVCNAVLSMRQWDFVRSRTSYSSIRPALIRI